MIDDNYSILVKELKDGNQNAFDTIFKSFYKLLCREARGFFRNDHVVEEIVCDVFLKLWNNRSQLTITDSLRDYLVKAVYNNCINYYRAQKVQERLKSEVDEQQKRRYALMDLGQDPLEYIITNELEEKVKEAIESLPPRYKEAFKLSRYNDLKYEEIAREMGISVNGVKINIKKALEHLREKLDVYLKFLVLLVSLSISKLFF
jgi:RNA polymerase sigma-70 factor (ECF subfamily)